MKIFVSMLLFSLLLNSCTSIEDREDSPAFAQLTQQFFAQYWPLHPYHASESGMNDYEAKLDINDEQSEAKKLEFYKKQLALFNAVDEDDLSLSQLLDKTLLVNRLQTNIWELEKFKRREWDPSAYNLGRSIAFVLEKEKRPLNDRIKDLSEKLLKSQADYEVAKKRIQKPTQVHLKHAIKQMRGLIEYLNGDVKKKVKKSTLTRREKSTANQRIAVTVSATKDYIKFLNKLLDQKKPESFRSFRIGEELYKEKFNLELQVTVTPEELYKKALQTKEDIRSKMFETAISLYPKYYGEKLPPKDRQKVINNIIKKVSSQHGKASDFVDTVRKQLPQLTQFVKDKDLVTMDPTKPLKVRVTPLYERGFAGASVDAPGPFDKKRDTFYNVTPLDGMSKKQRKSYLREYNDYTLQILNIHEAIPGHYTQLTFANKKRSLVQSLFDNKPTIEGWAVYTERMMLEQGYGDNSEELWLMYYKWFLRVVTNTIIDYEIHNKNLDKKQAMKLMVEDAFQEKAEAEGKWHRAQLSQVQLASYFSGFSEIYQLREEFKEEEGDDFNLKLFHDQFLSYGSVPVKEIRKMMTL